MRGAGAAPASRWAGLVVWGLVAGIGLARSYATSLSPPHSTDLRLVVGWAATWLWESKNVYTEAWPSSNYPPHGIVLLAPLALVPPAWLPAVWNGLSLALAPVSGVLAARLVCPRAPAATIAVPTVMFLAWFGLRVGLRAGQFSVLALTLGLLAVTLADRSRRAGGVLLGLSLFKPHVGGAFFLWALLTGRLEMAGAAAGVVIAGLGLFALRLGESPLTVAASFTARLARQYGGPGFSEGWLELRPLVHLLLPGFRTAEAVHAAFLLAALALTAVVSVRASGPRETRDALVLGCCCALVLLAFFHNPYDLILLLPVTTALWSASTGAARWPSRFVFALAQALLVVDVPALLVRIGGRVDLSGQPVALLVMRHFDRLLVVGLFGVSCALAGRGAEAMENTGSSDRPCGGPVGGVGGSGGRSPRR